MSLQQSLKFVLISMGKYSVLKTPVKHRATPLFLMEFFKCYARPEREFGPNEGIYFSSTLVADNFFDN